MKKHWLPCLVVAFFGATMAFANGPINMLDPLEQFKVDAFKGLINPGDKAVFYAYDYSGKQPPIEFHIGGSDDQMEAMFRFSGGGEAGLKISEAILKQMKIEEQTAIALMAAERRVAFQLADQTIREFEQGKLTINNWKYRSKYFQNLWFYTWLLNEDTGQAYSYSHYLGIIEREMAGNWLKRAFSFGWRDFVKTTPAYRIITPVGELRPLQEHPEDRKVHDFIRATVKQLRG